MHRMTMGPSQANGGISSMGGMVRPHAPRPPMSSRPMHPSSSHHGSHSTMKPMRRGYMVNNYQSSSSVPSGNMMQQYPQHHRSTHQPPSNTAIPSVSAQSLPVKTVEKPVEETAVESEPRTNNVANSKEKTPMCLVNELARYNKVKHQYRLTSETGPAHKKVFTVTLRLGETEEYTAEGTSIKRAQHAAAASALAETTYTAPPPRQPQTNEHSHHRHAGAVMPTVELNALAMKLCQPVLYTTLPASSPPTTSVPKGRGRAPALPPYMPFMQQFNQRGSPSNVVYRVRVSVGGRAWLGEGSTPQGARHDAAARALLDLRPTLADTAVEPTADSASPENGVEILNSDIKSPVSLVHELALKKDLSVTFSVKSEKGPPHMRVFITTCTVGELEAEGEGNGKKISKRRAAEKMLEEMKRRWPPALLRARPPPAVKRKQQPPKKKSRNLIKENGVESSAESGEGADNPISRLAQVRHASRARSPQYRVLEERGVARRREFLVQCDAPPHQATGTGPNKKTAKRRAAKNVLLAMENGIIASPETSNESNIVTDVKKKINLTSNEENRQPVPGVLLMDYHQRLPQSKNNDKLINEEDASANGITGAKDQLLYLAQLLGFTVQFSDFPKRNRGSYLSLVSLTTEPPVMCHGGGASTALSHEHCSRNALTALAKMGLDAPPDPLQAMHNAPTSIAPVTTISNGVSE